MELVKLHFLFITSFVLCVVLCVMGLCAGFIVGVGLCGGASPEGLSRANEEMSVVDCMQPVGVPEHRENVLPRVCFSLITWS